MIPVAINFDNKTYTVPRARGDDPTAVVQLADSKDCSPRTRG